MPRKLKTHKSIAKRFWITKQGKVKTRTCGQDHFNARESGKTRRQKRQDITFSKSYKKAIQQLAPYL